MIALEGGTFRLVKAIRVPGDETGVILQIAFVQPKFHTEVGYITWIDASDETELLSVGNADIEPFSGILQVFTLRNVLPHQQLNPIR